MVLVFLIFFCAIIHNCNGHQVLLPPDKNTLQSDFLSEVDGFIALMNVKSSNANEIAQNILESMKSPPTVRISSSANLFEVPLSVWPTHAVIVIFVDSKEVS